MESDKHTNADMIRNMSDEELAEFLDIVGEDGISSQYADVPCDCCCEKTECSKCWKEWLQSEAEIEENMDRYLFKAKRISDGEWVVGYIIRYGHTGKEKYYIVPIYASDLYCFLIDKTTICQCTGLKDNNGKLIWENDVVKCVDVNAETEFFAVVEFGNPNGFYSWGYQLKHIWGDEPNLDILLWIDMEETGATCEIIGNIFDNKELLEK